MLQPIPYLDLAGYKRRTKIAPESVDLVDSKYPGYIEHCIAEQSSRINARLAKRYIVPLGQSPPVLVPIGTAPPPVTLVGRPTLGSFEIAIEITTPGPMGTAVFQWTSDGGQSFTTGALTGASVPLGATGLSAVFSSATPYSADNVYLAATPVPAIALGWVIALVDVDVWDRRGTNAQDPHVVRAEKRMTDAVAEIQEAANSETGLFELPTNDPVGDSAVDHGGPLFYTEQSPYVWTNLQRWAARFEDINRSGETGGS